MTACILTLLLSQSRPTVSEFSLIASLAPAVSSPEQTQSDLIVFLTTSKMIEVKAYKPAAHSTMRLIEIDGKLKESDVLVRALVGATGFLTVSPLSSLVGVLSISSFFDTGEEIDGTYRFKVRYGDTLANWTSKRNGWGKKSNVGKVESETFKLTFKKSRIIGFEQSSRLR